MRKKPFLLAALLLPLCAAAQTAFPLSYDFEYDNEGWHFANGTNAWVIGCALSNGGDSSLYVSNNGGVSNSYDSYTATASYAWHTLENLPAGQYTITFDWKCVGESYGDSEYDIYDYMAVFVAPANDTLIAGILPGGSTYNLSTPAGWTMVGGTRLYANPNWQTMGAAFSVETTGNYKLIFLWRNNDWDAGGAAAVDNIVINPLSCPAPTGLTLDYATTDSLIFHWTAVGAETEWAVRLSGGNWEYAANNYFQYSDLSPNTMYTIEVKAVCALGDSSLGISANWKTACPLVYHEDLPFSESFDSYATTSGTAIPCWTRNDHYSSGGDTYPYPSGNKFHGASGKSLYFYSERNYTSGHERPNFMSLPEMDSVGDLTMTFWFYSTSSGARLQVGVMTDPSDTSTFVPLDTIAPNPTSQWNECEVDFHGYTGNGKFIAFRASSTSYSSMYVDDVVVTISSSCPKPTSVSLAASTPTSATINWTDTSSTGSYRVEYSMTDTSHAGYQILSVSASTSSASLTGLLPNTEYSASVYTVCQSGLSNARSITFRTPCEGLTHSDLPYSEDFDSYEPGSGRSIDPCWKKLDLYSSSGLTYPYPYSSTHHGESGNSLYFYTGYSYDPVFAILPALDTLNDVKVNFFIKASSPTRIRMDVGVMSDPTDSATFVLVGQCQAPNSTNWHEFEVSFATYTGTGKYIAFRAQTISSSGWGIYLDDATVSVVNSCATPTGHQITGLTNDEATVRWSDSSSNANAYQVVYFPTVDTMGVGADTIAVADADSLVISGLLSNTQYTIELYAQCDGSLSDPAVQTFATACDPYSLPFSEDFEAFEVVGTGIPTMPCYTRYRVVDGGISYSGSPRVSSNMSHSGSKSFYMSAYSSSSMCYLVFPLLNEDIASLEFSCMTRPSTYETGLSYNLTLGVMDNPADPTSFVAMASIPTTGGNWQEFSTSMEAYQGSGHYIALRYWGDWDIYVDDARIDILGDCPHPTAVSVNNIGGTSAVVSWVDTAHIGDYEIIYSLVGDDYTNIIWVSDTTTVELTGLEPNSEYTVSVSTICGSGTSTERSASFHTSCIEIETSALPFVETFDSISVGALANCWSRLWASNGSFVNTLYPHVSASRAYSGNKSLLMKSYNDGFLENYSLVVLPVFETSVSDLILRFQYKMQSGYSNTELVVGMSNGGSDTSDFVRLQSFSVADTDWHEYDVRFTEYSGSANHITIMQKANGYSYWDAYPDLDMGYIDNVVVDMVPSCYRPDVVLVSNITSSSATVEWHGFGTGDTFLLRWSDTDSVVVAADSVYTITSLQPQTDYTVQVSTLCDEGYTSSRTANFSTPCVEIPHSSLPWFENFDSYAGASYYTPLTIPCWEILDHYNGYTYYPYISNANHADTDGYALNMYGTTSVRPTVALPLFDDDLQNLTLSFYIRSSYTTSLLSVGVLTDDGDAGSFVAVDTFSVATAGNWQYCETGFPAGLSGRIAFHWATAGTSYGGVFIDDIIVASSLVCTRPLAVRVDSIGTTTAAYVIDDPTSVGQYQLVCTSGQGADTIVTNTLTGVLTGLTEGTVYSLSAVAICPDGSITSFVQCTFTTTCTPMTRANLPYEENFDAYTSGVTTILNDCWQGLNFNPALQNAPYPHDLYNHTFSVGNGLYFLPGHSNEPVFAVMPPYDTVGNIMVTFWMTAPSSSQASMTVGVMGNPSDTSTFIPIETILPTDDWQEYGVDISVYTGNSKYIAFRANSRASYNNIVCIDDIRLDVAPKCPAPSAFTISDATLSSATINVVDTNTGATHRIIYTDGIDNDTAVFTGNSYTMTDLRHSAEYEIQLSTLCANGVPTFPLRGAFQSQCAIISHQTFPYVEDFDLYPANRGLNHCWTVHASFADRDFPFMSTTVRHGSSGNSLVFRGGASGTSQTAVLPDFDTLDNVYVNCFFYGQGDIYAGNAGFILGFMPMPEDETSFIPIDTLPLNSNNQWHEGAVQLPACAGSIKNIAFRGFNNSGSGVILYLDDIIFSDTLAHYVCPQPTLLSTTSGVDSIVVEWSALGDSSEVAITQGAWTPDALSTTCPTGTYTFNHLQHSTEYHIGIRSLCNNGTVSDWTVLTVSTDAIPCFAVEDVSVTNISFREVTLGWHPVSSESTWQIQLSSYGDTTNIQTSDTVVIIDGLVHGAEYAVRVRPLCGPQADIPGDWSVDVEFSTPDCPAPSGITVSNVSANSATVAWTAPDNTFEWNLSWGTEGFSLGEGILLTVSENPYTITGLEANTAYDVYVATMCQPGVTSIWSNRYQFTTNNIGIDNIGDSENIQIYPNPASSSVAISLEEPSTVIFTDINGREIKSLTLQPGVSSVSIRSLPASVYFVKIMSVNTTTTVKIVVKR